LALVASGAGVAVMPEVMVRAGRGSPPVIAVPLLDDWARRQLVLCTAAGEQGEMVRALCDAIVAHAAPT
ncbi:MAG: LysR substrate-binding domain-containing protein, partial [Burkholderiaceae bacterium]